MSEQSVGLCVVSWARNSLLSEQSVGLCVVSQARNSLVSEQFLVCMGSVVSQVRTGDL